ncbi:hypothetical protein Taro_008010 [Colocasia esculenta]|uniref:Uncharacterized protein n=1 Tax=Colocasia esculenta TaxID=4460 RepID=A0A843U0P5_COLES|nr:hypothetical protein [Colocasia esculenta]
MSPPLTARHEHDPCTNGATPSSARPPQHEGGTPKSPENSERAREREGEREATYPMAPSIKPEGDSGYVVFKKATYPLSQSQTELEHDAIGTTSRQSPCSDPEDGAKGPRGPRCYNHGCLNTLH